MSRLVFDIETAAYPFDSFDPERQEYLLKFAKNDDEREQEIQKLSLYPYTAETVCIGLLNVDSLRGEVFINAPEGTQSWQSEDMKITFHPCTEHQILEQFWERIIKYSQLISFNGRGFDGPFLHIRSAILGIKSTRNLVGYRYESKDHCDLLDQLNNYGATRRFSLDFICKGFDIDSPKSHGITGLDIARLHNEGRYKEIAEYNARDLFATRELFLKWDNFINVQNK